MNARTAFPVLVTAGFLIWSSAFLSLYAVASVGCAFGWPQMDAGPLSLQRAVLVGLWVAHLAAFLPLACLVRRRRLPDRGDGGAVFMDAPAWTTGAAFAATVFTGLPAAVLTACA